MINKGWLIAAIFAALALPGAALNVDYKGYVSVDSNLKASLQLKIEGNQVTGELYAPPVAGQNIRLPGARVKLQGTLKGTWEDGGSISGDCSGSILWPGGQPEERAGQFWISKTSDGILFRSTKFYYNRYIFNPAGVKYVPPDDSGKPGKKTPGVPKNIKSSLILLIDCSSSMTGKPDKFERFKATAKTSLASLSPSCEMAVIVFAGCNNIKLEREFTPMTDAARNDFTAAIDALTSSGGTPLAQALSYAGDYMRTFAAGQTRQIILLSDGAETCNGDPAAAAAGLNVRQIGGTKDGKGKMPTDAPVDIEDIDEISVQPQNFDMQPDSERAIPYVIARMKNGDRKTVPPDQVKWKVADNKYSQYAGFEGGKVKLSKQAKPNDAIKLLATVKRAKDELKDSCLINVKATVLTGRVTCWVCCDFDPPVEQDAFQLESADIQVTRMAAGDTITRPIAGRKAVFDNLARGHYRAAVLNARMSKLPAGYARVASAEESFDGAFELPRGDYSDYFADREKTTPACTCAGAAVSASVPDGSDIPPPSGSSCPWHYDMSVILKYSNPGVLNHGCVYGHVTWNGAEVEGVTVIADKTGHQKTTETDADGFYSLYLGNMEAGAYWIRAERLETPRWAHPRDLLDAASYRDQRAVMVNVPLGAGGCELDIICVERDPGGKVHKPPDLP